MTKVLIIIIFSLLSVQCKRKERDTQELSKYKKVKQDSLIQKYVINCAKTYNYRYQMLEWQNCLDSGLKQDSTVAYLWQQKAMPYFKNRKYEVGMEYLNKAVRYNPQRWLSYRAFIKCIFVKSYKESIKDFELCIKMEGNTYVQDHTYNFYIALCYLQLNKYKKAEHLFEKEISNQEKKWREAHFLDLLYFGLSKYEQGKYIEAIVQFDKSLKHYPNFSEALYYKSLSLFRLNRMEEYTIFATDAKKQAKLGNTINESNAIYETYPYQVIW